MADATSILDIIENGIFIVDRGLTVFFWNTWLTNHTGVDKNTAQGRRLQDLFPKSSFKLLKRKVRIALKLKSSTFTNSTVDKYVIPIELKRITQSIFQHMRQDVVITPLDDEKVSVIIYDASALLEARTIINDQFALVQKQATTDSLTQCNNRKMFNDLLHSESKRANRYGKMFSLIIFDIDNFKDVNDTYGHLTGDEVLKEVASIATKVIRQSDVLARWGGEEFAILLPETPLSGAVVLAEKVRIAIATHNFGKLGRKTCSFGVAEYSADMATDILISNSDRAMYYAKNNGKNLVAICERGEVTVYKKS